MTGSATAQEVIDAFGAAGLPVSNQRNNTAQNCGPLYPCIQLITTDDISVYQFPDEAKAAGWAADFSSGVHHNGTIVLNYAGARTPEGLRPQYEAVLAELMANS